ncbi:MAG: hypothetical protein ACJA0I_001732 [Gammaproteobacteria bacterium]|jgi:hypothetical protein
MSICIEPIGFVTPDRRHRGIKILSALSHFTVRDNTKITGMRLNSLHRINITQKLHDRIAYKVNAVNIHQQTIEFACR